MNNYIVIIIILIVFCLYFLFKKETLENTGPLGYYNSVHNPNRIYTTKKDPEDARDHKM